LRQHLRGRRHGFESAARIRLLLLDVDGVMTDGRLYFGPRGEVLKAFHVRDGHGIRSLRQAGIEVGIISGRQSRMVAARCRDLGIRHLVQGAEDKVRAFEKLRSRLRIPATECACVGDDVLDVGLMRTVRVAFAVADAHPAAMTAAHFVTTLPGGYGAVREVCDYLLEARGRRQP
jgi:3-deoxy-D-manno-octulosonate 8-phosphate phosphatase (KDO 8-P phosphatase)